MPKMRTATPQGMDVFRNRALKRRKYFARDVPCRSSVKGSRASAQGLSVPPLRLLHRFPKCLQAETCSQRQESQQPD